MDQGAVPRMIPRAELVAATSNRGCLISLRKNQQFITLPFGLVFCTVEGQTENPQSKPTDAGLAHLAQPLDRGRIEV